VSFSSSGLEDGCCVEERSCDNEVFTGASSGGVKMAFEGEDVDVVDEDEGLAGELASSP